MELTIYRGTHEVGGTVIELNSKSARILLDAGYPLFLDGELMDDKLLLKPYQELLELGVIPQIKGLYQWDSPEFDGVVISHAHSDHFGLLKYIHPRIPIYCTETTQKLIELSLTFPVPDFSLRTWCIIEMEEEFCIGDVSCKPYLMDHSAFGAAALEIRGERKTVIYTGDFRNHGRCSHCLERFLREAPKHADLLLIEGTNVGRTGCPASSQEKLASTRASVQEWQPNKEELTEAEIQQEAEQIFRDCTGIVLVQPTSQNIDRIISFYQAAKACGRLFVIDIYVANLLYELNQLGHHLPAPSLWNPGIRVFYPALITERMRKTFGKKSVNRFRMNAISKAQIKQKQKSIVMMIRPSMLLDLKMMKLKQGDFIYSLWQAYRNKPPQIRLDNYLKSQGFTYHYLHTSGHAFEQDIQSVIYGLEPKKLIPIHTFCPEAFLDLSIKVEVQQDGIPFEV